jgi:hypothetical protein
MVCVYKMLCKMKHRVHQRLWFTLCAIACLQWYFMNRVYMGLRKKKPKFAVNLIGCNRVYQYDLALRSIEKAASRVNNDVVVYASIDCVDKDMDDMVKGWGSRGGDSLRVVYVKSYQMGESETEQQAAKLDERVARHWLSSNNRVFDFGYDNVIYLESDHVVSVDFFEAVGNLIKFTDNYCPKCLMMNVGCHGNCHGNYNQKTSWKNELAIFPVQNIGVVYRREAWMKFIRNIGSFCSILGDWDVNLQTVLSLGIEDIDPRSVGYTVPRVLHTTTCYTSRRKHSFGCNDPDALHEQEYIDFTTRVNLDGGRDLKMTSRVRKGGVSRQYIADMDTKRRCLEASKSLL